MLRFSRVHGDLLDRRQALRRQRLALLDEENEPRILVVVRHYLEQLREVPGVPLAHAHRKRVDVLVKRIQDRNRLDDVLVRTVHIELHLCDSARAQ